jgi:hypothetical protein
LALSSAQLGLITAAVEQADASFAIGPGVWHFYLGGKFTLARIPVPQEATQMSSNMKKYIGLDVHKDATSIAVLNGVGKLVDGINHLKLEGHAGSVRQKLGWA